MRVRGGAGIYAACVVGDTLLHPFSPKQRPHSRHAVHGAPPNWSLAFQVTWKAGGRQALQETNHVYI